MNDVPSEAAREYLRGVCRYADLIRRLGIRPSQVQAPRGYAGFGLRMAAMLADVDCPCGGEHLRGDHDDNDGPFDPTWNELPK